MLIHPSLQKLERISWYRVKLRLKNLSNTFARQHPLTIFHAIFLSARQQTPVKKNTFFFHPCQTALPTRIQKNACYDLELIFPAIPPDHISAFMDSLALHLQNPANNFHLLESSTPERRTLTDLKHEWGPTAPETDELCLQFITCFPFDPKTRKRRWLVDRDHFFRELCKRLKRFYPGFTPNPAVWQDIRLLPYYWEYNKIKHQSKSQPGKVQFINGAMGPLYLRGPVHQVLPLLLVCSELHAGRGIGFGRGYYILKRHHPFFDRQIVNQEYFAGFIARQDRESDLADEIAAAYIDQPAALKALHAELCSGVLTPRPAAGFYIDKRRKGQRFIASLELADLLIQKFIASLLGPVLDKMFEEASVGFRKDRSRDTARKMIRQACSEGYCYVLESDVASFFDKVDWRIMTEKIDRHLPKGDTLTRQLLQQVITMPLTNGGHQMERHQGLVQGSPLSPLLSNLYLDSFDEQMAAAGFRLVRYGDDFLVMTRSPEEAEAALRAIREILAGLKLTTKDEKTRTTPVDMGFSFLGISFDAGMDEDYVGETPLGKTMYMRHQYAFAGLDGDSVIIKKDQKLMSRLPLRRISEIVVLGTNTISSRLLDRCAAAKIPVSFCSPMGWYYSTLRPDSKRHYLLAAEHSTVFTALSPAEHIKIAARIVTAKLHNYLAWFKERWPGESRAICQHVETSMASLAKADDIAKIRGYEGEAARRMFSFINGLCKPGFECKKRNKRSHQDYYNSLLDFAYSLLFTRLNVLLRSRGLNPYLGILHSHKDNYESLVCDLQEPFRCRIDRFVIKTINREIIRTTDFGIRDNGAYWLKSKAVAQFIQAFEREMQVRLAGDGGTLQQLLSAQVQSLCNWVSGREGLRFFETGANTQDLWISGKEPHK